MIAFLPVTKYRVQYQVGTGRPYSALERLVLEGVGEGLRTLNALCDTFLVHRRVVVEAIVTLMQAGWMALAPDGEFVLSELGQAVLKRPGELPPSIQIQERTGYVILERAQGQVARNSDVAYSPRVKLNDRWQEGVLIPKGEHDNSVQPGMVESLLYRDRAEKEWIRWIGPINIVRDNADFVVVHVDPGQGLITGLPPQWEALLREDLLDRARRRQVELRAMPPDDPALRRLVRRTPRGMDSAPADTGRHLITLSPGDLLTTPEMHRSLLVEWLHTAKSHLAIASAALSAETVTALQPKLLAAVERGVLVDILWGDGNSPGHGAALKLLKKMEYDSLRNAGRGRLMVNHRPTGAQAEILLGDPDGTFAGVLGSHRWLSDDPSGGISLRLRHPGPLAPLCHVLGDLAARDEHLANGAGVLLLRNSAAALEERTLAETISGNVEVRLVLDRQHMQVLAGLVRQRPAHLWIGSLAWSAAGRDAAALLRDALAGGCRDLRVCATPAADAAEDQALLIKGGAQIEDVAGPGLLSSGDLLLLSSWRWLAPVFSAAGPRGAAVGVLLRGEGVAAAAASLFAPRPAR